MLDGHDLDAIGGGCSADDPRCRVILKPSPSNECYTSTHKSWLVVAMVGLVSIAVVYPVFCAVTIRKQWFLKRSDGSSMLDDETVCCGPLGPIRHYAVGP